MTAYVIGHITVKDPEKWAAYRAQVPATITPFKGELVLRGHRFGVWSGTHSHTDTVVLKFPDVAAAENWYRSKAYQALIPLREKAADMTLIAYEAT
jgi:uncharacterized protein (DUF1330 family)